MSNDNQINQRVAIIPWTKRRKRNFLDHLYLDGLQDLNKATNRKEKLCWLLIVIFCYSCAIAFGISTFRRYKIGRTVVLVENNLRLDIFQSFPQLTVCHSIGWNKTYFQKNVKIPKNYLDEAKSLGLSESQLLTEFSNYVSRYNCAFGQSTKSINENIWPILTEIFDYNFQDVQFADFVSDAAFRGTEIFRNCSFSGNEYPCKSIHICTDVPSCYVLATALPSAHTDKPSYNFFGTTNVDKPVLSFKINLPTEIIFQDDRISDSGVRTMFGRTPTPFSNQIVAPANTHALIEIDQVVTNWKSKCKQIWKDTKYADTVSFNYDNCIIDNFEKKTETLCKCTIIAGIYYPRNFEICTPQIWKECINPKILESSDLNASVNGLDENCERQCRNELILASATFYNLENADNSTITNMFTIRLRSDKMIEQTETELCQIYVVICDLANVLSIYTGLSGASAIHTLVWIIIGMCGIINRKIVKEFLGRRLNGRIPLAFLENQEDYIPNMVKRYRRVHPTNT